jgi:hypothetical protein
LISINISNLTHLPKKKLPKLDVLKNSEGKNHCFEIEKKFHLFSQFTGNDTVLEINHLILFLFLPPLI